MKRYLALFLILVGCASTQRVEDLESKLQAVQIEQAKADLEIATGLCGHDGLICVIFTQDKDSCVQLAAACQVRVNDAYKHRVNRIKGLEPALPEGSAEHSVNTTTIPTLPEPEATEPPSL